MRLLSILLLSAVLLLSACTKSGSDENVSGVDLDGLEFFTDCGVVLNGFLKNPVNATEGIVGTVEVIASNQIIFRTGTSEILVKLQGINASGGSNEAKAVQFLRNLSGNTQAVFIQASDGCTSVVAGGGVASVGQLFTLSGLSFAEELVKSGFASVERNDVCSGVLVGPCYIALEETDAPVGAAISNFLWKPSSERDGNLVILYSPGGATTVVNGETLTDFGASNGRGTTARANKSGAGFGTNITVEAFNSEGIPLQFPGGATSFTIPNGANRVEF